MFVKEFGWHRLVLGLMAGVALLAFGASAVAQHAQTYWGDDGCGMCHEDKYTSYLNHGHPWKLLQTAGTDPTGANNPYPASWGPILLPPLPTIANTTNPNPQVSWSDIEYILGDSKNNEAGASYVFANGYMDSPGRPGDPIPARKYSCGSCHTTHQWPYTANSTPYNTSGHQLGLPGITGTWGLDGIQCEMCHGAKATMSVPTMADQRACPTCHTGSATDPTLPASMGGKALPFAAAAPYVFTGHHPQGDDFSHSAHKTQTCWICHDPHKSVWHEDGGVLYSEPEGVGNMCKQCHTEEIFLMQHVPNLECVSCHMPQVSESGAGAAHIFRIASTPAQQLMTASPGPKSNTHTTGSGTSAKTWWNVDATTPGSKTYGDAFLTLDLACGAAMCHPGQSVAALATTAPYVHRPTGALGLTVNGSSESPQMISHTDNVTVAYSVYTQTIKGTVSGNADIYVACSGPKGMSYLNSSGKWVTSATPYVKGKPVANLSKKVVFNGKLAANYQYTYWVWMNQTGKPQTCVAVSVSVY